MLNAFEPRRVVLRHRRRPVEVLVAGEGPPMLLLHGWGLSGGAYRKTMRLLAQGGRRVIAPSLAVLDEGWSLAATATLAAECAAALDAPDAAVVGHSFGGAVAVRMASEHPEFASMLVLADAVGVSPGLVKLVRLAVPGRHWRVGAYGSTAAALLRTAAAPGGLKSLAGAARFVLASGLKQEAAILRKQRTPVVVLWAERDSVLPLFAGERLAEVLGAELEVVRAGDGWPEKRPPDHDWPFRAPAIFAAHVERALARLERSVQ